jgi:hypothetical protein
MARGVNRTEDNKVKVVIVVNRVIRVAVSKVVGIKNFYPNRLEVVLTRNEGVIVESGKIQSRNNSGLWSSEAAFKKNIERTKKQCDNSLLG